MTSDKAPTVKCKHCDKQIYASLHVEGRQTGMMSCDTQDTGLPYGLKAHPIGTSCVSPCLGANNSTENDERHTVCESEAAMTEEKAILVAKVRAAELQPGQIVFLDNRWREVIETGLDAYEYPEAKGMPPLDNRYTPIVVTHDKRLWGRSEGEFPKPDPNSPVRAYVLCSIDLYDVQVEVPMSEAIVPWKYEEAGHAR